MIDTGTVLQNRYRVVQKLGSGGFGETFEVDDRGAPKVLKVLRLPEDIDSDSPKLVSLFEREAKVLAKLRHPGIPQVESGGYFTFAPSPNSIRHCLVMEKIEGQNLKEWLKNSGNQPIAQEQALDWLKQLAVILDELHRHQYFHRDIKPENIMLKPDGQLVLVDFGAVREITSTYLGKIGGGREGTALVSAGYTPLEQSCGKAVPQSDFYALGRTFAHLLTGSHPVDLGENLETGELIWREKAPQISASLADLIDWLMAPFPGKRPPNTQVILQYLEAVEKGLPVSVGNPAAQPPAEPASGFELNFRRPTGLFNSTGVKVGLAGLLLGLAGLSFLFRHPVAIVLNNHGQDSYRAGQSHLAEFLYGLALIYKSDLVATHYNLAALYEHRQDLDRARAKYEKAIHLGELDTGTAAKAHCKMGRLEMGAGNFQDAESHFQKAIELDRERAAPYCLLAQVLESRREMTGAQEAWENCLKQDSTDSSPELEGWRNLARVSLQGENKMILSRE